MPESPPFYDLEATVSEGFINRSIKALIASGRLPTSFIAQGGFQEGSIGASERHVIELQLTNAEIFTETGNAKQVGLAVAFAGKVTVAVKLDEWRLGGLESPVIDPALEEIFEIPFRGDFKAIGQIEFAESGGARYAVISFRALQSLNMQIGDLVPGPNFTEVIRRVIERIAVVELRMSFKLPEIEGLPASLPAPLKALLGSQSGEIGLLDFKVSDVPDDAIGDDFHILFQAKQNLGLQKYDRVHSRTDAERDVVLTITSRWMREVQQDFWQGGVIPRRFSDEGKPAENGPNDVEYVGLTPLDSGALRLRLRVKRKVIGIPVTAQVTLDVRPYMEGQYLRVEILDKDITLGGGDWAWNSAYATLFFALYEVFLRAVLRGANFVLSPWGEKLLEEFLEKQRIKVAVEFVWAAGGLKAEIVPTAIPIRDEELGLAAHINLTTIS